VKVKKNTVPASRTPSTGEGSVMAKRGRPKLPTNERRSAVLVVRLTKDELRRIEIDADRRGLTTSEVVRRMIRKEWKIERDVLEWCKRQGQRANDAEQKLLALGIQ
jgi:hypothetical protein